MRTSKIARSAGTAILAFAIMAGIALPSKGQTSPAGATLDAILKEISTYDGGIDSAAFWKLRDYVHARMEEPAARAECEAKLLAFLGTEATSVAKMAACRMLRLIGSERSVPVLEPLLTETSTADMALYALQRIPGPAVDEALLKALTRAAGPTKVAIIAALGERKNADAVPALSARLKSDRESAAAAATALGTIGNAAACDALAGSFAASEADIRSAISAALLRCAEGSAAAGDLDAAAAIYEKLLGDPALAAPLRQAAMIGKISAAGDRSASILLELLQSPSPDLQEAAILKIVDVFAPAAIGQICSLLPGLPDEAQVQLLAVLSRYPADMVLPAVLRAATSSAVPVRIAALKALESVGDASTTAFLAQTAAKTRGAEQNASRSALGRIKGRAVDETILELIAGKPADEVQSELLLAVAERRIFAAKSNVAGLLTAGSPRIRIQALKTLRAIGTPSDIPAVLDLILDAGGDAERAEAETTAAALAQKIANPDGRANVIKNRLAKEKHTRARALLLSVLSRIGDDSALPLLRAALKEQNREIVDAAARAIFAWPTPAARDDVALLARSSRNETHRLLALQGLIRMIGLEKYRKPEAAVSDLKQASRLARRPEEKKLILGLLPRFACREALDLASRFRRDRAVKAEAEAAFDKIRTQLSS